MPREQVGTVNNYKKPSFSEEVCQSKSSTCAIEWANKLKQFNVEVEVVNPFVIYGNGYCTIYVVKAKTVKPDGVDYTRFITELGNVCKGCEIQRVNSKQTEFQIIQPQTCKEFELKYALIDLGWMVLYIALIVGVIYFVNHELQIVNWQSVISYLFGDIWGLDWIIWMLNWEMPKLW